MRALALVALLAGFVVAVILPNEIGTQTLPAVDCKVLSKDRTKSVDMLPINAVGVCWTPPTDGRSTAAIYRRESVIWRSARTSIIVQISLPILI